MSTDELLSVLKDRGLDIYFDDSGNPRLRGNTREVSPRLLRVLKLECHRSEILRRFGPKPSAAPKPRRIVLLENGRDSDVERVLQDNVPATGAIERTRELALANRGRMVALEWLSAQGWVRYTWIDFKAAEENANEPAASVA